MRKMVRAELTAFLSLIFLLLLSLIGAVIQAASIQLQKNEKRADATRAIESVYAEYQKELFEEYGILGIEATYESGDWKESNILNRLSYYGMENMETDINALRLLTDQNGKPFFEQAVNYQKEKMVLGDVNKFLGTYESWQEMPKVDGLESEFEEKLEQLPEENNPLNIISDLKRESLLQLVVPKNFELSENQIRLSKQVSHRELKTGEGLEESSVTSGDAIFFNFYLANYFNSAVQAAERSGLRYELEYLFAGKKSDKENLEEALKNICNIRFLANYAYLMTDEGKKTEATLMAGVLCSMIPVPGVTEIASQAILLAWAYGESVMDLRVLMEGKKVELMKNRDSWQLSIQGLMDLKDKPLDVQTEKSEKGLTYEQYLQMLLLVKKKEVLSMRALDLIELHIVKDKEQAYFRADHCVVGSKVDTKCRLDRGITYQFTQSYQYQ